MEVTTGESWKRDSEIGNDRDSENVETTTHGEGPPWVTIACVTTFVATREWAVFTIQPTGRN